MPAPTNISAASATDLGTLPASVSQDTHDSGTTYAVWYRYTAIDDDVVVGVFGYGSASIYTPRVTVYTGPASSPVAYLNIGGTNKPIQVPVTPGETYYFRFQQFGAANPTPAVLTLEVESFAQQSVPVGSIAVNDDTTGFPLAIMDGTTGDVIRFVQPFPAGEAGDILIDGTVLVEDIDDDDLKLYDDQLNQIAAIPYLPSPALRACHGTNRFWVAAEQTSPDPVLANYVTDAGALGPTHTLTGITRMDCIAASNDETILYLSATAGANLSIRRWDLVGNVELSPLAAAVTNYITQDILVLADDTILASYIKTSATINVQVRRYNAAGTLLNTYDLGSAFSFPSTTLPRLAYAIDNPDSFWIFAHRSSPNIGISRFLNIEISGGATLATVDATEYERGTYVATATPTPTARFGNSFSCPFWITRTTFPAASSGTIQVVKVTVPETDGTAFDFTAGGGLTPDSFSLAHGDTQTFNSVPAGDGYSVLETPNLTYQTTVTVSNGSDPTNITVEDGETVTVTFTNSAVITPGFNTRTRIRRYLRRSPIYSKENARAVWPLFQVDATVGVGNANEPGVDPQMMMRFSDDGGHTWSYVLPRSVGLRGRYNTQVQWHRCGMARNKVFEVFWTDPVRIALMDAFARVDIGTDLD